MQLHKAVRHLVLAQASRAALSLRLAGEPALADDMARTADLIEFAPVGETPQDEGDQQVTGRAVVVRIRADSGLLIQRTVPAARFQLYSRSTDASARSGADHDPRAAANAEQAAALFADFHASRKAAPLSAVELAALRHDHRPVHPAASRRPSAAAIMALAVMTATSVFLADGPARVFEPITIMCVWWLSRVLTNSEAVSILSAAIALLWSGEPVADAVASCLTAAALTCWVQSEVSPSARAATGWAAAFGVSIGLLSGTAPRMAAGMSIALVTAWIASAVLFVRFSVRRALLTTIVGTVIAGTARVADVPYLRATGETALGRLVPMDVLPAFPWAAAFVFVLVLLSFGGWLTGTHRQGSTLLLPVVLTGAALGTIYDHLLLNVLAVVPALTISLVYRALRPLSRHRP